MTYSLFNLSAESTENLDQIIRYIVTFFAVLPKLLIVFISLLVVLRILYGVLIGNVAAGKGHSFIGVFVLSFLAPILGILYVIGLPDLEVQETLDDILNHLSSEDE